MEEPFRILLVDDEAGIRKILRLFLEREGYKVFEAYSFGEAQEILLKKKPHLMILDVVLSDRTGFEICEWVKENPETKDTIVMLFTALNQNHDYKEGKRVKCDHYLTKPQNPKDIVKEVKRYLCESKKND